MLQDFTIFLWLLKLGALLDLYFLATTFVPPLSTADPSLRVPAQILFAVSAFRCVFPNQYKHNVVFHDTPLSSIFLTRVLATVAEVAFVYQLSRVLRLLDVDRIRWVDALSWLMVVQVVVSQLFVWGAILTGRLALYFWGARLGDSRRGERGRERRSLPEPRRPWRRRHLPLHQPALRPRVSVVAGRQPQAPDRGCDASRRDLATLDAHVLEAARPGAAASDSRAQPDDRCHGLGRRRRAPVDDGVLRDLASDLG